MQYFVTGATGFIGKRLVKKLLARRGSTVYFLVRPGSEDEHRMMFNDAAADAKPRQFPAAGQQPQKGRYKDLDPDIDYETPAFLRNQAD